MILILGGAGFIGTNLIPLLLKQYADSELLVVDKTQSKVESIASRFAVNSVCGDVADVDFLEEIFKCWKVDAVIHLAANSDIRSGTLTFKNDFKDTLQTSLALAEITKVHQVSKIVFASSSAIFGVQESEITGLDLELRKPTSAYGWAKLASEYALEGAASSVGFELEILRFPNVVGPEMTHGMLFDFRNKLALDSRRLDVLGNGYQSKPYMHCSDLVEIIVESLNLSNRHISKKLVGPRDTISIREIVEMIKNLTKLDFMVAYENSEFGWDGDVPRYSYGGENLVMGRKFGTSREAVNQAIIDLWGCHE